MSQNLTARRTRLHAAISTLTAGAQRRYPPELRSRIADYSRERIEAGVALTRVCSELGVSHPTLVRFLGEKPAPMRRVRVAHPRPTKFELGEALPTLVVRGPAGVVIEGLDVKGVAALVRALS